MSREIANTGGNKEFHYAKEDLKRIESQDTESTREFKAALREWRAKRKSNHYFHSKKEYQLPSQPKYFKEYELPFHLKAKKWGRYTKYKIWKFFKDQHRDSFNPKPLIKNVFIILVIGILMSIVYVNLGKLNEISILFLRLGSCLFLLGAFFVTKYFIRLYKNIRYLIRIQKKWIKYTLALSLLILSLFAYQNRISLFDPVVQAYEETDFEKFSPFSFSLQELSDKASSQLNVEDLDQSEASTIQNILTTPPKRKSESKEAFAYINNLRKKNGKKTIDWNDNIYDLAVARSKDMYERNYFDHKTPEGSCANTMKADYGLNQYTLAENIGAVYEGYNYGDMSYSLTINVKEQVDNWMESRGHRYNLLYDEHVAGAVGCYYGVCTFLGAHTKDYGLGAGSCTSGTEGEVYWNSADKQPGEI